MICSKCGAENAEEVKFCASCGNEMAMNPEESVEEIVATEENVETAAPETEAAPKKDVLAPVKPLLEKVKPFLEKYKLFVIGAAGLIALILCISILASIFGGGNGYDPYKHNISVEIDDGEVVIIYDAKKAKATDLEASYIDEHQASLDGSVVAILTDAGELAVVKGTKLTRVAEEVVSFVLSVDGTGLGYVTENDDAYTLTLYNVKNKKAKTVTEWLSDNNIQIAPNGDSIAYFEQKEDAEEASLMFFKGSKSTKITSTEVALLGIANNGKYIYAIAENDEGDEILYSYNTKGDRDKIGACNTPYVCFNEDHTQILYFNREDGYKSYISTKGKEGNKIASSMAVPLTPNSCEPYSYGRASTIPTDNLYNKVYVCSTESGNNIWYIRKNTDKSVKLVNGVSNAVLSEDGDKVYYVDDNELKVLKISKGDNASDKAKLLAEDVDNFVITSDGKKVYYTSDNSLYCVNAKNGKGKKTIANDDVKSRLYINGKDVVYYIMEGDLYASKNGSKGKKVLSDVDSVNATANGIVYVSTDDAYYATKGAKKPSKIWTQD